MCHNFSSRLFFDYRSEHFCTPGTLELGADTRTGAFGSVTFCQVRGDQDQSHNSPGVRVAIKTPLQSHEAATCFLHEILAVVGIPPCMNLVHTMGFYTGDGGGLPTGLVMRRYDCTLYTYLLTGGQALSRGSSRPATWHVLDLLHLLVGVANGLRHIHASGFLHNDLSTRNVFVSAPCLDPERKDLGRPLPFAVIGDLGRATSLATCQPISLEAAWLARRTVHESDLSAASDVFSLGTIVLSALGGVDATNSIHSPGMRIHGLREPSTRLHESLASYPTVMRVLTIQLMRIVHACTHEQPACRPTAAQAHQMLWHLTNDLFKCLV